jgi:hypothetical protein
VHEEPEQEFKTLLNRKLNKGSYTWIIVGQKDKFGETGIGLRFKNGRRIAVEMNGVEQFLEVIFALLDDKTRIKKFFPQREGEFFVHRWRSVYDKLWIALFSFSSFWTLCVSFLMINIIGVYFLLGMRKRNTFQTTESMSGVLLLLGFWGFWLFMLITKYIMHRLHVYSKEQYIKLSERLVINDFNVELEDIQSVESVTVNPLHWLPALWQYRKYDLIALESAGTGIVLQMKYGKPILICISGVEKLKTLLLHRLNTSSSDYLHPE